MQSIFRGQQFDFILLSWMLDNYKKQMIKCKKIGSGGFGVVYKVSVYGVVKAIKIIKLTDIE